MVRSLKLWSSGNYSQTVPYTPLPTLAERCNAEKTERRQTTMTEESNRLFELLLGAELVGVATLALAAVGGTGREAGLRSHVSRLQSPPDRGGVLT